MKNLFLILLISFSLTSCFTPINLNFDSARTLNEGGVEVQGAGSVYTVPSDTLTGFEIVNTNIGLKFGYGVSKKYDIKFRSELLSYTFLNSFDEEESVPNVTSLFFQLENKIALMNEHIALSLPVGLHYYGEGSGFLQLDPAAYFTLSKSNKFEFTIIPKVHVIGGGGLEFGAMPAISINAGFSSDLDNWAIRPAIGYDRYLSFGAGFSYYFNNSKPELVKEGDQFRDQY